MRATSSTPWFGSWWFPWTCRSWTRARDRGLLRELLKKLPQRGQRGLQGMRRGGQRGPLGMRQGQGRAPKAGTKQARGGARGPMGMKAGKGKAPKAGARRLVVVHVVPWA